MVNQVDVSQLTSSRDAALLTAAQAADFLGVSVDTLARWRQQGGGPRFIKFNRAKQGVVRYRPTDLERFIGEHVQQSTSDQG